MKKEKIKPKPCIYLITNTINNKKYVGQTKQNLYCRNSQHKRMTGGCILLNRAVKKYGWDVFIVEVIEYCEENELDTLEIRYIDEYKSFAFREDGKGYGYNCTKGGKHNYKLSDIEKVRRAELRSNIGIKNDKIFQGCIVERDGKFNARYGKNVWLKTWDTPELAQKAIDHYIKTGEKLNPRERIKKKVKATNLETGEIKIYNSQKECREDLNFKNVSHVLRGLRKKHPDGYHLEYWQDNE